MCLAIHLILFHNKVAVLYDLGARRVPTHQAVSDIGDCGVVCLPRSEINCTPNPTLGCPEGPSALELRAPGNQ
jgi:hypothetical protein